MNGAGFKRDRSPLWHLGEEIFGDPFHQFLGLHAIGTKPLVKVAFKVQQGDGNRRCVDVRGRSNRVACENSEAAA